MPLSRIAVEDAVDVAAGIDHHAGLRLGVEQDRAVLLERGDRHDACVELSHGASGFVAHPIKTQRGGVHCGIG